MNSRSIPGAGRALALAVLSLVPAALFAAVPTSWEARGPGGGGALFSPSFLTGSSSHLYVACDMSELFRSTDLGATWGMVDSTELVGNRAARVCPTSDPQVLYSIDHTGDVRRPSKSTDGGLTWTPMAADPTAEDAYWLGADPASTQRLLVSDWSNLYFSSNGGTSFTTVHVGPGGSGLLVGGAFWDGTNIYVGTSAGLLVSTNNGASFVLSAATGLGTGEVIASFSGAKAGATTRLFAVTMNSADVYPGYFYEDGYWAEGYIAIRTLDVGAASWQLRTTGIAAGDFPQFVATSRSNILVAYTAGQRNANEDPLVYKTTDGGLSWTNVLVTNLNGNIRTGWAGWQGDRQWSYGAGPLGFAVAPDDPSRVAWTDLGFVHLSTDGGATWKQRYLSPADENPAGVATPKGKAYASSGLENTSVWWVTWADASNVFGSYSDIRGARSTDGGAKWSFNYTGHSQNSMYRALRHPSNGWLYAGTSSAHDIYQTTYLTDARLNGATGLVIRSTDSGATWTTIWNAGNPVIWVENDPNNTNRLYASVIDSNASIGGIWVTNNLSAGSGSTWTKLPNPTGTEGHPFNIRVLNDGMIVTSWSARRDSVGAFTPSSGVFVSTNGGTSWVSRTAPGLLYYTKDVVIDPHDATQNTWWAGVWSGWGGAPNGLGGLYRTTDRGVNWTRVFNSDRVSSCAINPSQPGEMFVTTETEGLWYSSNSNTAVPTFSRVNNFPFRQPERVFWNPHAPAEVWVTGFGGGIRVGLTNLDADGDGVPNGSDCAPSDGGRWAIPGPARTLALSGDGPVQLSWASPLAPGGTAVGYDLLRSSSPSSFAVAACIESNGTDLSATDAAPPAGDLFYLVRAENACGGNLGTDSSGTPRSGTSCP